MTWQGIGPVQQALCGRDRQLCGAVQESCAFHSSGRTNNSRVKRLHYCAQSVWFMAMQQSLVPSHIPPVTDPVRVEQSLLLGSADPCTATLTLAVCSAAALPCRPALPAAVQQDPPSGCPEISPHARMGLT